MLFRGHNSLRKWDDTVDRLVKAMLATDVDGVITYAGLSAAAGIEIDCHHTALRRALRVCRDSHAAVFVVVATQGYRRISAAEAAGMDASRSIAKVYRASRRGVRRIRTANPASLTPQQRAEYFGKLSVLEGSKTRAHGNSVNAETKKNAAAVAAAGLAAELSQAAK